ncbi:hypothetical protein AtNW77_Chr1g0078931 [Arabidopsis thaliana]
MTLRSHLRMLYTFDRYLLIFFFLKHLFCSYSTLLLSFLNYSDKILIKLII